VTFDQLEDLFYAVKITASPSAFHGFLCGRLTCGAVDIENLIETSSDWLTLSDEQCEAAEPALRDFFESSLSNLEDVSFLFQPLLPEDELPLGERLSAVGEWASNYISGLAEGMESNFEITDEGKEALDDLAAIGQISVDFEAEDEGERDYTELVEYIRIAVQVIFTDLHPELKADLEPTIH
jgi:uncharacterized protein YgfB (UPF0149 family)|tara:strand:- start:16479 stop:17024 length:546 start_codon:yes stop_codon:yes gene_type:complete